MYLIRLDCKYDGLSDPPNQRLQTTDKPTLYGQNVDT